MKKVANSKAGRGRLLTSKLFNIHTIPIIIALFIVLLSIGYSAFGTTLNISGATVDVRIDADIRVTGINIDSASNGGISTYEDYNVSNISMGANLPNSNSTLTYKVKVTNFGNVEMGIYAINNLPSNLEYELSDYTLQDKICVNGQCSLGIIKEFYITIKYKDGGYDSSNTIYPLNLDIDFRSFHQVTYEGFTSTSGYPKEVIDGGDLIVNFIERVPDVQIKIGNVSLANNLYTFNSDQRYLYIPVGRITDDVTITFIADPPTITFALVNSSAINSNGWAKENFYVEATITDNSGKGIASASSCTTTSSMCTPNASFTGTTKNFYITTEGSNVACVTATDNNGKSTTVCSDPYKLDKTAPTAGTATFTGTLGSNNWYTSNVTVNIENGTDSLSGHYQTTVSGGSWADDLISSFNISSNTTGFTFSVTTRDLAGNSSTRNYTVKVDKNSPTFTSGPAVDTVEVYLNDSNVISNWFDVSYSTSGGSMSCTPNNTNYFDLLGTYTATCTATGGNGKTASVTQSVRVLSNGLYDIFIKDAVADNISSTYVSSSSGINFSQPASTTNGLGVYRAVKTSNSSIYYYRGNVTDNNVLYAGYCWKMVITTEDRGVKLIYNGLPSSGRCTRTGTSAQIGTSAFNSIQTDNAYVGYMYGAPETSTVYGDVNDSGSVTAADYLLLKRFVVCANDYVIGDVNGDGRLTSADRLLLQRFINGTQTPTEEQELLGDVNGDGELTSSDVTLLTTYINNGAPTYDCTQTPTEEQELLGDVNLDGSLTVEDYVIVKDYVLKQISSIIGQNSNTARYNATHKNRNNSTIKTTIDSWYRNNMTSYTSDLEDAVWCNDRSKSSSYLGYGNWTTYYSAYNRSTPSLTCTNANDRFTVSTSNGNGALTYPVGLLTYDEYILAGRTTGYLNSGSEWWTLTPYAFVANAAGSEARNYAGSSYAVGTSKGVRPAIVLKYGARRTSGTGTTSDPFVVE